MNIITKCKIKCKFLPIIAAAAGKAAYNFETYVTSIYSLLREDVTFFYNSDISP
ncbi:hypothetical protein ANACOL_02688 [Anaerotruncus colihominis DSM 17241]|uniref:Uncharacterized protein n=1 Tax=Anaerotruncus colihominis DSM 17241 TaxID=445972 RepID=B0PD25_9FIRM|nr:hypothetical protein ANACOL_02688 [Anaerotruncus colihominis DSM 17241]